MLARSKQTGFTLIGFMMMVALVGFFALVLMKLFPLYNESYGVTSSLNAVASQDRVQNMTAREIERAFLRNAQINGLRRFNDSNIHEYMEISRDKPRTMTMAYEARNNLFGNLDIIMVYEKTLELGRD